MTILKAQGCRLFAIGSITTLLLSVSASAAISDLQTIISGQNPSTYLQFNNNLNNIGSGGAVFTNTGGGFGNDLEATALSARSFTSNTDEVSTTTDVITGAGSLSLLFRMPDVAFTDDRYLFDGGNDTGLFDDDSFQLRWNDEDTSHGFPNGVMDVRLGNTTFQLNGPNPENHLGEWFYYGMTWDDSVNTPEGHALFGRVGDTLSTTELDFANNDTFVGDGGTFTIGNRRNVPITIPETTPLTSAWQQTGGDGFIDEFAIWTSPLEVGQLQVQFNRLNGIVPAPDPIGDFVDTFEDGSRTIAPGGINWYAIGGTPNSSGPRPGLTVQADSAQNDLALFVAPRGSTQEIMGVLGQEVALGEGAGSTISVKFDMRLDGTVPTGGEFRFGLYGDTDNELGTGGWGDSDGNFDRQSPGAGGDEGVFARISLGTGDGTNTRIAEEAPNPVGNNVLGGSGTDQIAGADAGEFAIIDDLETYEFELLFTRVAQDSVTGEDVMVTLTMDDGTTVSKLIGLDGDTSENDTTSTPSIFDYFLATTTTQIDWVLDNFQLNVVDVAPGAGDFDNDGDVDGSDFLAWQRGESTNGATAGDLAIWSAQYSSGAPLSSAAVVPEPTSLVIMSLSSIVLLGLKRRF